MDFKNLITLGIGTYILSQSCFYVPSNQKALVYQNIKISEIFSKRNLNEKKGEKKIKYKIVGKGLHFKIPFVENFTRIDINSNPRYIPTTAITNSKQMISITVHILSKPNVSYLSFLFDNFGINFQDKILSSIANHSIESVFSKLNFLDFINNLEIVEKKIGKKLKQEALKYHLEIDEFSITHIGFDTDFSKKIDSFNSTLNELEKSEEKMRFSEEEKKKNDLMANLESEQIIQIGNILKKNPHYLSLKKMGLISGLTQAILKGNEKIEIKDFLESLNQSKKRFEEIYDLL
ncbi:phb [Anaeramoeba ignava]|uniref:Prohibitin n=1 Tax=Anaeramoeba ignava TaxID=1746090 RepID=A0A9Q0LVN8_ANAIG|nr:phb [Anaeramoeba ignava]